MFLEINSRAGKVLFLHLGRGFWRDDAEEKANGEWQRQNACTICQYIMHLYMIDGHVKLAELFNWKFVFFLISYASCRN